MTKKIEKIEIVRSDLKLINTWALDNGYELVKVISRWQIPYCFDVEDYNRSYYEVEVKSKLGIEKVILWQGKLERYKSLNRKLKITKL